MQKISEFTILREQAGLDVKQAALLLEVSERMAYRYDNGTSNLSNLARRALKNEAEKRASKTKKIDPIGGFTFIDLFAGIGGLRKGFEKIGGTCVFSCEWDRHSRDTYVRNNPATHEFGVDVRDYSKEPERIPVHDVLLAGFPCQPFSLAGVSKKNALGRPHGFLCDTQGTLFFDLAQIIAHCRPTAFLLENVKNLESHDGGKTFATIMNVLKEELGYDVHTRVINSEPWVPQKRERIFIVGFREKSVFSFDDLKIPTVRPKLGSILEESVDPKYTLTENLWNYLQAYKAKHATKGNGFGCSVFGPSDVARTLSARYYKDGSEILIGQPGTRPRRLTPRECARLMGFDRPRGSSFEINVSDTQAYRQFGNAVVVPVVEAVARSMKLHIEMALSPIRATSGLND